MALTVKDCMKIGILQNARIVAGNYGLYRPVESVTVIEFDGFTRNNFQNTLTGNEMAISAFSFLNDATLEEKDAFFLKAMKSGISCLVVFYYGTILKSIPQEAIQLANDSSIPLIILPESSNYAYSDLIMPICEAIITDRRAASADSSVVSDILNSILGLEKSQQNIQNLLTTLSIRTHYNLILTDTNFSPFAWSLPSISIELSPFLSKIYDDIHCTLPLTPQEILYSINANNYHIRFQPIHTNKMIGMLLILQQVATDISVDISNHIAEIISLFLQFWHLSHGHLTELELRLDGDVQNTLPKKYKTIVVVGRKSGLPLKINDLQYSRLGFTNFISKNTYMEHTVFKGTIVLAGNDLEINTSALLDYCNKILFHVNDLCLGQLTLSEELSLQEYYHVIVNSLPSASVIYKGSDIYTQDQIHFTKEINALKASLGSSFTLLTSILSPLKQENDWPKLFDTLAITYLDCNGSYALAADIMGVHINTVKYRISRAQGLMNISLNSPTNYSRLVIALAVERIKQ